MEKIYRVRTRSTGSVQPGETTWTTDAVHYVGTDVDEARIEFHRHEPHDFGGGYGSAARETVFEHMDPADLDDDDPGEMEFTDPDDE